MLDDLDGIDPKVVRVAKRLAVAFSIACLLILIGWPTIDPRVAYVNSLAVVTALIALVLCADIPLFQFMERECGRGRRYSWLFTGVLAVIAYVAILVVIDRYLDLPYIELWPAFGSLLR
ncbi:MAG: hypothetical protein WDZ79_02605 [Candidatus Paceibacterota bacterium]